MGRLIKSAVIGGVVYYLWVAIFGFMHGNEVGVSRFENPQAVFEVLKENTDGSGMYIYPLPSDELEGETSFPNMLRQGPLVCIEYLEGIDSLGSVAIMALIISFLVAFIAASLLQAVQGLSFFGKALFVMFVASTGEVSWHLQNWLVPSYSTALTLIYIANVTIGWFLAGMAMAKWGGVKAEG
ncbi:hypothetical protein KKC97_06960 [bacterium]|nr:hypothetical protein [bacterium]MBU1637389.1 hypothetical protein [bacterium]